MLTNERSFRSHSQSAIIYITMATSEGQWWIYIAAGKNMATGEIQEACIFTVEYKN